MFKVLAEECPAKDADEPQRASGLESQDPVDPPRPVSSPAKKKKSLGSWLCPSARQGTGASSAARKSPEEKLKEELTTYNLVPLVDGDSDPLDWWRTHERDYPLLASLARKYLCIQATSSPSERLFSKAGSIVTPHRSRLNPDKANMLIFLSENL